MKNKRTKKKEKRPRDRIRPEPGNGPWPSFASARKGTATRRLASLTSGDHSSDVPPTSGQRPGRARSPPQPSIADPPPNHNPFPMLGRLYKALHLLPHPPLLPLKEIARPQQNRSPESAISTRFPAWFRRDKAKPPPPFGLPLLRVS
jgi:hypothetical protein